MRELQRQPKNEEASTALNMIRTETALSRFPIHRMSKGGEVTVEIENQSSAVYWSVEYSRKYGQPGPLAYKIDTLIVNRRIEEAGFPLPEVLRLGSLNAICAELGINASGANMAHVRKALRQNALSNISAKISYKAKEGEARFLEADFSRYGIVFTGETLPGGERADCVYLVLSKIYREIICNAVKRPLDFDYMKALTPSTQRFYEIVSYQVYGAIKHNNPVGKVLYSDYCALAPAPRYLEYDQVKKQMYKLCKPHLESGYLESVSYERITNDRGEQDWVIRLVPGPNADREFREFTGKFPAKKPRKSLPLGPELPLIYPSQREVMPDSPANPLPELPPLDELTTALLTRLTSAGVNRTDAERLVRTKPLICEQQLEYLPYLSHLNNPGAYLRRAIEGEFGPPAPYVQAKKREQAEQKKQEQAQRKALQEATQKAQEAQRAAEVDARLVQLEKDSPEAFLAFEEFIKADFAKATRICKPESVAYAAMVKNYADPSKRRELYLRFKATP